MTTRRRAILGAIILGCGVSVQAALEKATETARPKLKQPLNTLPLRLRDWLGEDEAMDPLVLERTQASEWINRVYERHGQRLKLWINYSETGMNLRHSPEVCLPSGGWNKVEAQCSVMDLDRPSARLPVRLMRLVYSQQDMVQGLGFWYYIFGEGQVERYVRSLPITSRSSHGRTTRGSGLTVEVFCAGETDPKGEALRDFSSALLDALEPLLPDDQAQYHLP
ncbi:MAG: hypothetical protein JWN86_2417 [Planctomycetota bacterium]|nr:hypothetical protein [Planctomycetota bacterium]